jgi:hypothetical protein
MKPTPDTTARDALARSICGRISDERRTEDELRVIDDVLAGLEHGAETIGPLDLARDQRDFDEEGAQECRDLLAYLAMRKVAEQHRRRERLRCEVADEQIARVERGLRELRDSSETLTAPSERFDVGGEG